VASVSAGAIHHLKVARVTNLSRAIDWLKEQGIWVVGAAGEGQSRWFEFDYTLPVAIVLGSEGSGLRPNIRKKCDALLALPMLGQVKSLNVGAAAAVFFTKSSASDWSKIRSVEVLTFLNIDQAPGRTAGWHLTAEEANF